MTGPQSFLRLNLKSTEAHRLSWNNQYFNLDAFLLLDKKILSKEQAAEDLKNCSLIVKMNPFKNEFKAKLFSHILQQEKEEKSSIIAFTASINIFENKVLDILDIRETEGVVNSYGGVPLNADKSVQMTLTAEEKSSLMSELQKLVHGNMATHLRQPFVCFFPEFVTEEWRDRLPQGKSKATLIPFQALFPFAGAIDRVFKEQFYVLDDLYCTSLTCPCNEVNGLILTIDPHTGQEVLMGGFKYNFEKKTFKPRTDIPAQMNFNAQEWCKQFDAGQPIDLKVLFEARYHFLRKLLN